MSEATYVSGGEALYCDLFQEWEVALARGAISRFKARYPWINFPGFDDLLQECLTHWYFTRGRFEEDRGASLKTYMSRVIDIRLHAILRGQMSHNRRINHFACSLEEKAGESGETLAGLVPAKETTADIDLTLDVRSALSELTPFQRDICRLLSEEYPVKRIADILGWPRTTVRDQIKKIREVFFRRGLKIYLD